MTHQTMTRQTIDCRSAPNEVGCTLTISGGPEEVLAAAVQHAVTVHGHSDTPELREMLRGALVEAPTVSAPGAFLQLFEFTTDHAGEEIADIQRRWAEAIGDDARVRWSVLGRDRAQTGRYVAVVEFPSHDDAMVNSAHPATATFATELSALCQTGPQFHDLDVYTADSY